METYLKKRNELASISNFNKNGGVKRDNVWAAAAAAAHCITMILFVRLIWLSFGFLVFARDFVFGKFIGGISVHNCEAMRNHRWFHSLEEHDKKHRRKRKPITNCFVNCYGNVIFDFRVNLVILNGILIMRIAYMKNNSEVALKHA